MLYTILLSLHSILRWLVLIFGLLAIIRSVNGMRFKRGFTGQDNQISRLFTSFLDIQVLIGLILYFVLSPITTTAMQNFGGAMGNSGTRYFLVEHSVLMLLALIAAHVGRVMVRRVDKTAPKDGGSRGELARKVEIAVRKHRAAATWFAVSLVLVLAAIPWPFIFPDRPWLRFFGLF